MGLKPGYKQTDVGAVPKDWQVKPLLGLAVILHGFGFQSRYFKPLGKYRLTTPGHFQESGGFRDVGDKQKFYVGPLPDGYLLSEGDLIVAMTEQADGLLGSAALVPTGGTYLHNQRLGKIKVLSPEVSVRFLYRVFNSKAYRTKVRETAAGTKVKHTSPARLLQIPVPLPPTKAEQEAIANALSDVDALIESLEQLVAKKRHLKQGTVQELLTGKKRLPGFEINSGYKQTEMGGAIPQDWDTPELGDILKSMQLGGNYKNSERETSWPLIKMGNLGRGSIKLEKLEFIDSSQSPASKDRLRKDDVLFNTRNTLDLVGKVAIWADELPEAYFNSNIMRMEFDEAQVASKSFMNYILNTPQSLKRLRAIAIGTTSVAAIYTRDLVKVIVPLPIKAEQEAIAAILNDMDTEMAALEAKLSKARQIKLGMMQELLTGRIRLYGQENVDQSLC